MHLFLADPAGLPLQAEQRRQTASGAQAPPESNPAGHRRVSSASTIVEAPQGDGVGQQSDEAPPLGLEVDEADIQAHNELLLDVAEDMHHAHGIPCDRIPMRDLLFDEGTAMIKVSSCKRHADGVSPICYI